MIGFITSTQFILAICALIASIMALRYWALYTLSAYMTFNVDVGALLFVTLMGSIVFSVGYLIYIPVVQLANVVPTIMIFVSVIIDSVICTRLLMHY